MNNNKTKISTGGLWHPLIFLKNKRELYKYEKGIIEVENLCLELEKLDHSNLELVGSEIINNLNLCIKNLDGSLYSSIILSFVGTIKSNKTITEKKEELKQIECVVERWLSMVKSKNIYQAEYNSFFNEVQKISEIFVNILQTIEQFIKKEQTEAKISVIKKRILSFINKTNNAKEIMLSTNFSFMSPYDFEEFIAKLFKSQGYNAQVTSKTGDYGVDVIAERELEKIAIQCKRYQEGNNVGNQTVQMLLGAMQLKDLKANKGIIITTSKFTKQAYIQAESNDIELWDKDILHQKVREYFVSVKFK